MSAQSEDKLRNLTVWFFENYKRIPPENIRKRMDFQQKAIICLMEVVVAQAEDIQKMEQRSPRGKLWLPSSVRIDDAETVNLR